MSDIEWDVDDFEPPPSKAPASTDKWEGEDEEDEIRDNWDDEDEEKEKASQETTTVPAKSKKKKLADKIAEKEAKQQEEKERRKKELEERNRNLTPEEILEEKLRIQKIQEDADLQLANDLVGDDNTEEASDENKVLDEIDLSDRDGLQSFRKALVAKIRSTDRLEKRPFFINFVEDLSRDLCENLEMDEVKRVSSVLNSLYNEKVKASKPKSKKKGNKPKLNVAQGAIIDIGNDYGAEYDDFM